MGDERVTSGFDSSFNPVADDYALPTAPIGGNLISCNSIWYFSNLDLHSFETYANVRRNQLQCNPDFQDGKFDLDGLCAELRAKARCSESGVMVDQRHVDAALRKLGTVHETSTPARLQTNDMFKQESWDDVLKKLNST